MLDAMSMGEREHPLLAHPLQSLPDVEPVQQTAYASATTLGQTTVSSEIEEKEVNNSAPPAATSKKHGRIHIEQPIPLEEGPSRMFIRGSKSDPLSIALEELSPRKEPPPAGDAYATSIEQTLQAAENEIYEAPLVSAGVVDRSDVTLLPAESPGNAAAGIFIVRSRRNWALQIGQGDSSRSAPSSPASVEQDYYTVSRSIADFSWLEQRLNSRYDSLIIPQLPQMALLGRLQYGYMYEAERRRGLQRFLRKVATHAVLSTVDETLAFLGAMGDDAWRKIRLEPISHGGKLASTLFAGGNTVDRDLNPVQKFGQWSEYKLWQAGRRFQRGLEWVLERDKQADSNSSNVSADARLERLEKYVIELKSALAGTRQSAEWASRTRAEIIQSHLALQKSLQKLGVREGGAFGEVLKCANLSERPVNRQREFSAQLNCSQQNDANFEQEESKLTSSMELTYTSDQALSDVLTDFEQRAAGARRLMTSRREEQDAYEHAVEIYKKLRDRLESQTSSMWTMAPGDSSNPDQGSLNELYVEVHNASVRLAAARRHYQVVALSTTDELRRLRAEMHDELCDALHKVALDTARQHELYATSWINLAKSLEKFRETGVAEDRRQIASNLYQKRTLPSEVEVDVESDAV